MTREEAISWLKEFKWHEGEDVPIYETDIEAIDMAIKALEQEPTTKNDKVDCEHTDCDNCVNHKYCDYERTTKNDLPHCQCTDEEIAKSFIEDVEAVKDQLPCGEQMEFPNTFDEFAKDYGFKDEDEIYTNGSEFIPVFRVKQWLEHISTTKNDLGVDCISRKSVITIIQNHWWNCRDIDKLVNELPSVTPQEPKTGHWIISPNDCFVHCSECGLHGDKGIYKHYGWCPNCGAKMDEPQESEGEE